MIDEDCKTILKRAVTSMRSGDPAAAIVILNDLLDHKIDHYWERQSLILRATLFEQISRFDTAEADLLRALTIPDQSPIETYDVMIALAEATALGGAVVRAANWLKQAVVIAFTTEINSFVSDFLRIYPQVRSVLTDDQAALFSRGLKKYLVIKSNAYNLDEMSLEELAIWIWESLED